MFKRRFGIAVAFIVTVLSPLLESATTCEVSVRQTGLIQEC